MPWWSWMIVAALALAIEMFVFDAQFYLVFFGISAAIVGLLGLSGVDLPDWAQWLTLSVVAVVTMVTFRKRAYELVRARTGHVEERLTVGDRVTVPVRLEPSQTCRVDYRGSSWTARNVDERPIEAGREAVIARVDGLVLMVRSAA
ncbi:NfeD family protein [Steroidobacter sp. S1-65]|uniref:NfeD family protein n=1 Tax=Steroidobacter gossypii TaxID=2805490 RepID=A0ABS1WR68_9GAMM|nr:NfeD family protein [Steroidobacter gossypii]MBM0103471.1 NfeD family protein [Steroidobacter gossypii]